MASPPVTRPFLFAQLCQELTTVEVSTATIFNLYRDISGAIRRPYNLPSGDFMQTFYPRQGNFAFNCDISSQVIDEDGTRWHYLNNWDYEPGGVGIGPGVGTSTGLFDVSFNVVGTVQGQWAEDLNVPVECWTACSLLHITEELLKANYICNLKCNVCCSLCSFELAEALNSLSNADSNTLNQYETRTAREPVVTGDRLVLSILFTNANTGVNPVDIRLHFEIGPP